jgi:hypothetical protein
MADEASAEQPRKRAGRPRGGKAAYARRRYEAMWLMYKFGYRSITSLAAMAGVSQAIARRYIEVGDPTAGLKPLRDRAKEWDGEPTDEDRQSMLARARETAVEIHTLKQELLQVVQIGRAAVAEVVLRLHKLLPHVVFAPMDKDGNVEPIPINQYITMLERVFAVTHDIVNVGMMVASNDPEGVLPAWRNPLAALRPEQIDFIARTGTLPADTDREAILMYLRPGVVEATATRAPANGAPPVEPEPKG